MNVKRNAHKSVLYVIACAAPPAAQLHDFVGLAQAEGWDVYVITTPEGTKFIDAVRLAELTGHKVTSKYRQPSGKKTLPEPECIAVVPATFNTINKWAQGIADTFAVSVLCEQLGRDIPIAVAPCVKGELAKHPAFVNNIETLRKLGVHFLQDINSDDTSNCMALWRHFSLFVDQAHSSLS